MGNVLCQDKKQRYVQALDYYQDAFQIYWSLAKREKVYLQNVASTLNQLGALLLQLEQYDNAEAMFTDSLKIRYELIENNSETEKTFASEICRTAANLAEAILHTQKELDRVSDLLTLVHKIATKYPDLNLCEQFSVKIYLIMKESGHYGL